MIRLAPCGTYSAYQRHIRRGETPCAACRKANSEYHRQHRATHPERLNRESAYNGARDRALTRLAHLYPTEFEVLLSEELSA